MTKRKTPEKKSPLPARLTPEGRRDFVLAYADGRVVDSCNVPTNLLGVVFLPIALGGLSGWRKRDRDRIGLVYGVIGEDKTCGRYVNGFPMFLSCRLMLKEDFEELRPKIQEELDRRKKLAP